MNTLSTHKDAEFSKKDSIIQQTDMIWGPE